MAFLLLRGSDQNKYGSMIKGLAQQFSLGNDQYPKTIIAATDVLSTHKIDQKYFDNQKKEREKSRSTESRLESSKEKTTETSFNDELEMLLLWRRWSQQHNLQQERENTKKRLVCQQGNVEHAKRKQDESEVQDRKEK